MENYYEFRGRGHDFQAKGVAFEDNEDNKQTNQLQQDWPGDAQPDVLSARLQSLCMEDATFSDTPSGSSKISRPNSRASSSPSTDETSHKKDKRAKKTETGRAQQRRRYERRKNSSSHDRLTPSYSATAIGNNKWAAAHSSQKTSATSAPDKTSFNKANLACLEGEDFLSSPLAEESSEPVFTKIWVPRNHKNDKTHSCKNALQDSEASSYGKNRTKSGMSDAGSGSGTEAYGQNYGKSKGCGDSSDASCEKSPRQDLSRLGETTTSVHTTRREMSTAGEESTASEGKTSSGSDWIVSTSSFKPLSDGSFCQPTQEPIHSPSLRRPVLKSFSFPSILTSARLSTHHFSHSPHSSRSCPSRQERETTARCASVKRTLAARNEKLNSNSQGRRRSLALSLKNSPKQQHRFGSPRIRRSSFGRAEQEGRDSSSDVEEETLESGSSLREECAQQPRKEDTDSLPHVFPYVQIRHGHLWSSPFFRSSILRCSSFPCINSKQRVYWKSPNCNFSQTCISDTGNQHEELEEEQAIQKKASSSSEDDNNNSSNEDQYFNRHPKRYDSLSMDEEDEDSATSEEKNIAAKQVVCHDWPGDSMPDILAASLRSLPYYGSIGGRSSDSGECSSPYDFAHASKKDRRFQVASKRPNTDMAVGRLAASSRATPSAIYEKGGEQQPTWTFRVVNSPVGLTSASEESSSGKEGRAATKQLQQRRQLAKEHKQQEQQQKEEQPKSTRLEPNVQQALNKLSRQELELLLHDFLNNNITSSDHVQQYVSTRKAGQTDPVE
eukprot:gb/GEZN01002316.1/.p1 GENE.gb/GEZN01002316.1/~~gb/GEZN01002316.1/.p1  ORF type:complete len:781 (-),score=120.15 gb/GEZN01002316.1/:124-2466(-)